MAMTEEENKKMLEDVKNPSVWRKRNKNSYPI